MAIHGPIPKVKDISLELLADLKVSRVFVVCASFLLGKWPVKVKMITIER